MPILHITPDHPARDQVVRGTTRLIKAAGLTVRPLAGELPAPFDCFTYSLAADLVIVPSTTPLGRATDIVGRGMRMTRCPALIVFPDRTAEGAPTLSCSIGLWKLDANEWHVELRPWLDPMGGVWLVPAPSLNDRGACFRLSAARVRPLAMPWPDTAARDLGFARAERLFAVEG